MAGPSMLMGRGYKMSGERESVGNKWVILRGWVQKGKEEMEVRTERTPHPRSWKKEVKKDRNRSLGK